ncbi:hypothetical protein RFI_27067 [Reticulomyxa filosa]|uniref:Uncharacterized protein n=1 Tax=Reticulomyxa filosa TaxID=46433 RepID=X6M8R8_RETFI|nr:hypothetical protein RFI_27067 [Reticulomyxa filosa]|eukprot:ETO10309.1 hypothetical protein RFI_27067 [Reticulomyxa filosa]
MTEITFHIYSLPEVPQSYNLFDEKLRFSPCKKTETQKKSVMHKNLDKLCSWPYRLSIELDLLLIFFFKRRISNLNKLFFLRLTISSLNIFAISIKKKLIMNSQRKLTLFLYRSLLRNSKKLDSHTQLKLLIPHPLPNSSLHRFLDSMFQSKSLYFDDDLYFSVFSLVKHVRMAFRYTQELSTQFPNSFQFSEQMQLGFDSLKQLNDCLAIAKYIQLDTNEWKMTLKPSTSDPPSNGMANDDIKNKKMSEIIHDDKLYVQHLWLLKKTASFFFLFKNFLKKGGNEKFLKISGAWKMFGLLKELYKYYKQCIAENPTAEVHNNLGWMCYLKGKYTEYFNLRNGYFHRKNSDQYLTQSNENIEREKAVEDKKQSAHELDSVLPSEENVRSLNDGISVCKKHCRIAISLDKEFGSAYNNLGLMLMIEMQKGTNRTCEEEIEMLFGKAKQYQSCYAQDMTRSHPFKNHAKYLKNYKRDLKGSLKNYIWAVHFDRDDSESREMIEKLLPSVANAAGL